MDSIVVTGGAGFIGSNFVRRVLAETGLRVVVLDKLTYAGSLENLPPVDENPKIVFVRGDIADRETVRSVFAEHSPSAVVNFAAESHVDRSIDGPDPFIHTNISGRLDHLACQIGIAIVIYADFCGDENRLTDSHRSVSDFKYTLQRLLLPVVIIDNALYSGNNALNVSGNHVWE